MNDVVPQHRWNVTTDRGGFRPGITAGLALLGVPRVVVHDLDVVEGGPVNLLLVFGPLLVWIGVAVFARVANPLRALTITGLTYGVLLAATHQVLWNEAFADDPPRLGGNLEGELSPGVEELVLRGFAVVSSVVTGLLVGVVCGVIARALRARARS